MHNYIVRNDDKANYVEFNVNIPDGYNSFKVDYINGSIINQNYLKVGDTILFKFNNNPLRYDVPDNNINLNLLTYTHHDATEEEQAYEECITAEDTSNNVYKFIDANFMNYYQLIFLPIYTMFDVNLNSYIYIFNPCDNSAGNFLKEPVKQLPALLINESEITTEDDTVINLSEYAEFTGQYVLALVPTTGNKISDIILTVGESINNSKMRPQDVGSFQVSASSVNEVNTTTLQKETYNYGSTWNYPVHNLIMNHKHSVEVGTNTAANSMLVVAKIIINNTTTTYHTATSKINFTGVNTTTDGIYTIGNIKYQLFTYDGNNVTALNKISYFKDFTTPFHPLFIKQGDNGIIKMLQGDDSNIINNELKGNTLCNGNYKSITASVDMWDEATVNTIDTTNYKYIMNSDLWHYAVKKVRLGFTYRAGYAARYKSYPITNYGGTYYFAFNNDLTKAIHVCCGRDFNFYNCDDFDGTNLKQAGTWRDDTLIIPACCKLSVDKRFNNKFTTPAEEEFSFYLGGVFKIMSTDNNERFGVLDVIISCNFGVCLDNVDYTYCNTNILSTRHQTLQQYPNNFNPDDGQNNNNLRTAICDDILVNAKHDNATSANGIELSFNTLHNNVVRYIITVTGLLEYNYNKCTVEVDDNYYSNLQCFVPLKTSRKLNKYMLPRHNGFFIIHDMDNNITVNLTEANSEIYLSTGHETLNIEAANKDDDKFKTFNGSLLFDRSNSRITRLFSNDVTGSCLGYLNDLLSAKLSRYYTCVNYNAWNTFINTSADLSLTLNDNKLLLNQDVYTGEHEYVLASCFDIVKLIGSESIVNNCIPNIVLEQQQYNNTAADDMYQTELPPITIDNVFTLYYKFFHYYNSALDTYPYIGYQLSKNCGGVHLLSLSNSNAYSLSQQLIESPNKYMLNKFLNVCKELYVTDVEKYNLVQAEVYKHSNILSPTYSDNYLNYHCIDSLPAYRIYRNSNFEQTDLTITTGGVKTIHPIYLQSTPRILLNNVLYLFDFMINQLMNTRGKLYDSVNKVGGYYLDTMMRNGSITSLMDTVNQPNLKYVLKRFALTNIDTETTNSYSTDVNTLLLLNYCNGNVRSINDYYDSDSLAEVLPAINFKDNAVANEEIIQDIAINDESTCVQLFSNKFFKFYDNVDIFNVVTFKQQYVDSVYYNAKILSYYYDETILSNAAALTSLTNSIDALINNVESFNNLKLCKIFICKLGEFLDYPKILFGAVNTFMNSLRVSVNNVQTQDSALPVMQYARDLSKPNNGKYSENAYTVFDSALNNYNKDDNKRNTYMFGVIFKYHQLALGYQNLSNELSDDYNISKANGQRHFKLVLFDEYGRKIPNTDTSQGFKNNLMLELTLA